MIIHYIRFALRNLYRYKTSSIINITGLAIGLASSFFITIYVVNELSYGRYHENRDRTYRVLTQHASFSTFTEAQTAYCFGAKCKEQFPEIENYAIYRPSYGGIEYQDNSFRDRIKFASSDLFDILTINIIQGEKTNPLKEKSDVFISQSLASKLFAEEDPINKSIEFTNWGNKHTVIVRGIFQDFPWNSTFSAAIIAHIDLFVDDYTNQFKYENVKNEWKFTSFSTFLLLNPDADLKAFNQKLEEFASREFKDTEQKYRFQLQNLQDIYLHSKGIENNSAPEGNLVNIYIFSAIAVLILLIAGFNYIILSTAKATGRNKEIGLRKVFGASRNVLIRQFLSESMLLVLLALPIAYVLVELFTPTVSRLFAQEIGFRDINLWLYVLLFLGITLSIGLISGSYIAFYTSSFNAAYVLRNNSPTGSGKLLSRKLMIVMQLLIFIALLIGSLTIYKQIDFAKNTNLGFNKENIVKIQFSNFTFSGYKAYINSIKSHPNVLSTSYGSIGLPTESYGMFTLKHFGDKTTDIEVKSFAVGPNYLETFEIELVQGRFLSDEYGTDLEEACMLNETAVRDLGIKNPLNEKVGERKIVGVVKDFHVHSLRSKIDPIFIRLNEKYTSEVIVKISQENQAETIQFLEERWKEIAPAEEFDHRFVKDILHGMYGQERRFAKTTIVFTVMAILIACMGLFGLTLFIVKKRSREIGIRKIHGASLHSIMLMINKEFIVLVGIATVLAWPVAWYFSNIWLQGFVYTIQLPYEFYILSGLLAGIIVSITVSIRSLKAATSNPVDTIKHE